MKIQLSEYSIIWILSIRIVFIFRILSIRILNYLKIQLTENSIVRILRILNIKNQNIIITENSIIWKLRILKIQLLENSNIWKFEKKRKVWKFRIVKQLKIQDDPIVYHTPRRIHPVLHPRMRAGHSVPGEPEKFFEKEITSFLCPGHSKFVSDRVRDKNSRSSGGVKPQNSF